MDVGVRELKQHLSEYLDRVARGETIRVTDRGVPKAMITPLRTAGLLEQGIVEGWIRPATAGGLGPIERSAGRRPVLDVLDEDRDG